MTADQPTSTEFKPDYGARVGADCHFHQEQRPTPVCIITDSLGEKVIATSDPYQDQQVDGVKHRGWAVRSTTVNLSRLWSASTATIYLTCTVPHLEQEPPRIPQELHPEQQIAIYLGYIEGPRPVTLKDIEANRLIRVYIGVVDTATAACTGRVGYSVKIQCRDRVRWFMDSSLLFNLTQDENALLGSGEGDASVDRPQGIWFILNSAIGRDSTKCDAGEPQGNQCEACPGCGVALEKGDLMFGAQGNGPDTYYGKEIRGRVKNEKPTSPTQVKTNIYTSREKLNIKGGSFMLIDNSALETIKRFTYQEMFQTEFFQDPHTGVLYYAPRGIDLTGLEDPNRFWRRYFIRNIPKGMQVEDANQMILSYKEDVSTLNMRTNIVVGAEEAEQSGTILAHFKGAPEAVRSIPHACRYMLYQDQTLASVTEAAFVALALSREMGKLLRSADMTVIGDPSLSLGEVVQVVSTPLQFQKEVAPYDVKTYEEERQALKAWHQRAIQYFTGTAQAAQDAKDQPQPIQAEQIEGKVLPDGSVVQKGNPPQQTDVLCNPEYGVNDLANNQSYYKEDLKTLWRVDAMIHHFKSTGYVTQLFLGVPY